MQSKRPSETLESLISLRLARLAAITGQEVQAITLQAWVNALKFLMPQQIEAGFDRLESGFIPTAACPFPVPAHLLAMVSEAGKNQERMDAEQAWEDVETWLVRWYADCHDRKYPLMDERLRKSLKAAGGPSYVKNCPLKDLAWAKKRFIEAYLGLAKLEQDKPLLGSADVVKQIAAMAEGKQLK